MDRSRRGPFAANPPSTPSLDKDVHSDDEIFREIEDHAMEAEREHQFQVGGLPYMCSYQMSYGLRE